MNWPLDEFKNKDVVFVGAGKGRAMIGVKSFLDKNAEIKSFTAVDKKAADKPLDCLKDYDKAQTIFIKNEGVPGSEMPVTYITPMQIFFELVKQTGAATIGITGTKGKSTTTALAAHILETAGKKVILAGNIGVSPLTALDSATTEAIFVLELSSYQLSDLKVSPHISACLNLFNDHTDWHGSLENYWESKHNIMRFAGPKDTFIYNPEFPALKNWAIKAKCQTIAIDKNERLDLSKANLFGEHNRLNALVAREIARQFGISNEAAQKAIESFETLRHRMQFVMINNGRIYIDDAIGMTPESTIASLRAVSEKFGQVGCMLLGGQDRSYDFAEVIKFVASLNIPNLVLFPNTTGKMKAALPENYQPKIFETKDMAEAVNWAAKNSPENSVILLSTAAPSYSLWKDFEDKGDQFQSAVHNFA